MDKTQKYTPDKNLNGALQLELSRIREELVRTKIQLSEETSKREDMEMLVERYLDSVNRPKEKTEENNLDNEIRELREVLSRKKEELEDLSVQKNCIEKMLQKYLEGFGSFEAVSRLNSLIEFNPEAIVALDLDGLVLEWNPAAEKMFGWKKEEVIGKPYPLVDKEHTENFRNIHSRVVRGEQVRMHEAIRKTRNGVFLNVSISSMPLKNENDEIIGSSTIITDLTDARRRTELANRLATVVEQSPNLITITDKNQVIEYVNQSMINVTGYTAEELIGQKANILKSDKTPEKTFQEMNRVLSRDGTFYGDLVNKKKNGDFFLVTCSISPLRNTDGLITHYASIQEDITEISKLKKELKFKSSFDSLTGLHNEQSFKNNIDETIIKAGVEMTDHAVAIFDMDDFELINNNCGAEAGKNLIRQTAKIIKSNVQTSDLVARIGRDKFGILIKYCTTQQAQQKIESIRKSINETGFVCNNQSYNISASVGIAPVNSDSDVVESVISNAQTACTLAKKLGKNRSSIFMESQSELEIRQKEMELAAGVKHAITNNRLFLLFQPINSLQPDSSFRYFEVLVNMKGKDDITIGASNFMTVAEKYGLSADIDGWVINRLFDEFRVNRQLMNNFDLLTINLTCKSICQPENQQTTLDIFDRSEFPLSKLCIEFDESIATNHMPEIRQFMYAVKNRGCKISIEKFGTRISSFSYLQSIPFDFIKIDNAYTNKISENRVNRAFLEALNNICHVMQKETMAEFISDKDTLQELQDIGIDFAQGYAIGKPVDVSSITLENIN